MKPAQHVRQTSNHGLPFGCSGRVCWQRSSMCARLLRRCLGLFLATAAWPAWLFGYRPELLRLVFGILSLLLEEPFLRSIQFRGTNLIVSLSSLPVSWNGG